MRTEIGIVDEGDGVTLADVENLCAEARSLGFPDTAPVGISLLSMKISDDGAGHG